MKTSTLDFGTQIFRLILTTLGSEHRTRVSIGLIIGMILWGVEDYAAAVFVGVAAFAMLPSIGRIPTLAIGIGLAFSPNLLRPRVVPESYQTMFAIIDEAFAKGVLSQQQQRLAYHTVIQKAVAAFDPRQKPDFTKLANETVAQVRGEPAAPA